MPQLEKTKVTAHRKTWRWMRNGTLVEGQKSTWPTHVYRGIPTVQARERAVLPSKRIRQEIKLQKAIKRDILSRKEVEPITWDQLKGEMNTRIKKKKPLWGQPERSQPTKEGLRAGKKPSRYVSEITMDEVRDWDTDKVFFDRKVRGVRGLVVINGRTGIIEEAIKERKQGLKQLQKHRKELKDLKKELDEMLPETGPLEKKIIIEKRNVNRSIEMVNLQEKQIKLELESLQASQSELKREGDVIILSRTGKPIYDDFVRKHKREILRGIPEGVKDLIVLDTELYATKDGKALDQAEVTGYAKNSGDEKYKGVKGSIHAFDVLVWNGHDIRKLPLKTRKGIMNISLRKKRFIRPVVTKVHWLKDHESNVKALQTELDDAVDHGFEGIVVKDANTPYYHMRDGALHWIKAKNYETMDLRMVKATRYPRGKKPALFLGHWTLATDDPKPHVAVSLDKGIKDAGLNWDTKAGITKKILDKVDAGEYKASAKMVPVAPRYQEFYGREMMPESVTMPAKSGPIVEVFAEDMTSDYKLSGGKVVGFREDKTKADQKEDLEKIYKTFYGREP